MPMREPGDLTIEILCNRAIDLAGGQRQGLIDDSSEEGRLCQLHFPFVRDKLLYDHDWYFASVWRELAKTEHTPLSDNWDYQYELNFPELIRFRGFADSNPTYEIGYDINHSSPRYGTRRTLWTNEDSPIKIRYTTNPEITVWSQGFVETMIYTLAAELSRTLMETTQATQELITIAEMRKAEAMEGDAFENSYTEAQITLLTDLR